MKFEQAMRAMRRGEKVRRKGWAGPLYMSLASQTMMVPEADLFLNDWVIRRKKKKAHRDVFKEPRVGDVIGTSSNNSFWVVLSVTPDHVKWINYERKTAIETRDEWASGNTLKVIHRAEG